MNWCIWYKGNIKVLGETEQDWISAPDDGVIGIAIRFGVDEYSRPLCELISGSDWYWMDGGKIYQSGTSSYTPGEWLPHNAPESAILKTGIWTTDEELAVIENEMTEWIK